VTDTEDSGPIFEFFEGHGDGATQKATVMTDAREKYFGHLTLQDGSHVPLTEAEAKQIWEETQRRLAERAAKLPDEKTAIRAMFEAFDRLRELGWREAIYCPKDGSAFEVIEPGSTGVFRCHYEGEWPKGSWWIEDDGDLYPSHPILFRLYPEDEEKRKAKMAEAIAKYRAAPEDPS